MNQVAVLGCGPSGMMAAWAVRQQGLDPVIFSIKKRSPIGGAQYLHRPIDGLTADRPEGVVEYIKYGTADCYARKVYGNAHQETSWDRFHEGQHEIWSLRKVYDALWYIFEPRIVDMELKPNNIEAMLGAKDFATVLSCIPLKDICIDPSHHFEYQTVWIEQIPRAGYYRNEIVYDGTWATAWYRQSVLFGIQSTEWPGEQQAFTKAVRVRKPIRTDCDCWMGMHRLGRYGAWEKKLLTHDAYQGAVDALHSL